MPCPGFSWFFLLYTIKANSYIYIFFKELARMLGKPTSPLLRQLCAHPTLLFACGPVDRLLHVHAHT